MNRRPRKLPAAAFVSDTSTSEKSTRPFIGDASAHKTSARRFIGNSTAHKSSPRRFIGDSTAQATGPPRRYGENVQSTKLGLLVNGQGGTGAKQGINRFVEYDPDENPRRFINDVSAENPRRFINDVPAENPRYFVNDVPVESPRRFVNAAPVESPRCFGHDASAVVQSSRRLVHDASAVQHSPHPFYHVSSPGVPSPRSYVHDAISPKQTPLSYVHDAKLTPRQNIHDVSASNSARERSPYTLVDYRTQNNFISNSLILEGPRAVIVTGTGEKHIIPLESDEETPSVMNINISSSEMGLETTAEEEEEPFAAELNCSDVEGEVEQQSEIQFQDLSSMQDEQHRFYSYVAPKQIVKKQNDVKPKEENENAVKVDEVTNNEVEKQNEIKKIQIQVKLNEREQNEPIPNRCESKENLTTTSKQSKGARCHTTEPCSISTPLEPSPLTNPSKDANQEKLELCIEYRGVAKRSEGTQTLPRRRSTSTSMSNMCPRPVMMINRNRFLLRHSARNALSQTNGLPAAEQALVPSNTSAGKPIVSWPDNIPSYFEMFTGMITYILVFFGILQMCYMCGLLALLCDLIQMLWNWFRQEEQPPPTYMDLVMEFLRNLFF